MSNDTPITNAAWNAAKEQTDTNDNPDWGCVAHDMRDKCEEIERENARLRREMDKTAYYLRERGHDDWALSLELMLLPNAQSERCLPNTTNK